MYDGDRYNTVLVALVISVLAIPTMEIGTAMLLLRSFWIVHDSAVTVAFCRAVAAVAVGLDAAAICGFVCRRAVAGAIRGLMLLLLEGGTIRYGVLMSAIVRQRWLQ